MSKKPNIKKYWKVFFTESLIFLLTALLAIFSAIKRISLLEAYNIPVDYISVRSFVIQFAVITLLLFLASKTIKKKEHRGILFKSLFILAIFSGGVFILSLWFSDIVSLVIMGVLILLWNTTRSVLLHNLCVILGIAGTTSVAGLNIKPLNVVLLLVLFSIYDFIAVYKTKHMVKMAKSMIRSGAILGFVIPHRFSNFYKKTDNVSKDWAFVLGGGDIAFPLLLVSSLVSKSILDAYIVAVFSFLGLFLSFWIFVNQKKKKPFPALPPIALLSVIGYFLIQIF